MTSGGIPSRPARKPPRPRTKDPELSFFVDVSCAAHAAYVQPMDPQIFAGRVFPVLSSLNWCLLVILRFLFFGSGCWILDFGSFLLPPVAGFAFERRGCWSGDTRKSCLAQAAVINTEQASRSCRHLRFDFLLERFTDEFAPVGVFSVHHLVNCRNPSCRNPCTDKNAIFFAVSPAFVFPRCHFANCLLSLTPMSNYVLVNLLQGVKH